MAVSIDWGNTYVIHVPTADLIPVGGAFYRLDVDWFRRALKTLEAGEAGQCFPDTHKHTPEVVLSGVTFARVVEILAPYSVEFENGSYAVTAFGANHNIADRLVLNSVSLVTQNSAGLIRETEDRGAIV
jgi:hypothetical protein